MDNDDIRAMLLNIRRDVLSGYPFPPSSQVDNRYAMVLGLIAGLCTEALQAVNQNRTPSFVIEVEK